MRVARACRPLGESDSPVTEIGQLVGCNDVANSDRRFREIEGLTPSECRKPSRERCGAHDIGSP